MHSSTPAPQAVDPITPSEVDKRTRLFELSVDLRPDALASVLEVAEATAAAGGLRPDPERLRAWSAPPSSESVSLVATSAEPAWPVPESVHCVLTDRLSRCQAIVVAREGCPFDAVVDLAAALGVDRRDIVWPDSSVELARRLQRVRRVLFADWTDDIVAVVDDLVGTLCGAVPHG